LTGPAKTGWIDLGLIGYVEAFAIQTALHERVKRNDGPGTILFQENSHIITCRRWASAENLLVSHETLLSSKGWPFVRRPFGLGDLSVLQG